MPEIFAPKIGTCVCVIAIRAGAVVGRFTRTPEARTCMTYSSMSRTPPCAFHSIFWKLDGIYWPVSNAIGITVMTFTGQNYGARQPERIRAKDLESVKADDTARVQKLREERPSQRPPSLREQLRRAQEARPLPGANAPERER